MADSVTDLQIDSDRQVFLGDDGDLATVSGIPNVEQSVAIEAGDVLRPLIGEPMTDETFGDVEAELEQVLSRDPQIDSVERVNVTKVNTSTGTVTVSVFTSFNNSFEIEVTP